MNYLVCVILCIVILVSLLVCIFTVWRPLRRMTREAKRYAAGAYRPPQEPPPEGCLGFVPAVWN
ncbi:MAG: hypothetical protein LIO94_04315, partial [Clostridiales bacterium]|nr:hypothetical protein [Clostridiales bacterium]